MKKLVLIIVIMVLASVVIAQDVVSIYSIANSRKAIGRKTDSYSLWVTQDSGYIFLVKGSQSRFASLTNLIGTGTVTQAIIMSDTGLVYTTTNQNIYGVKTFKNNTIMNGTLGVAGLFTSGIAGTDGKITIYSEQGATDYSVSLNPNATMTSAANFYLPADEPAATYPLTVTSGGVMGYGDQNVLTTSAPTFATVNTGQGANELYDMNQNVQTTDAVSFLSVSVSGAGYLGYSGKTLIDSNYYYDDNSGVWAKWVDNVTNTPSNYLNLQNLRKISLQNKAGTGQVAIITGDTSQSETTANLTSIHSIDGSTWLAGTGAFSTTLTRMAIYIAGAAASDIYAVSAVSADAFTRPGAGEQLIYFAKTDSLVVMRQTGTTSGLGVSYIRIK